MKLLLLGTLLAVALLVALNKYLEWMGEGAQ